MSVLYKIYYEILGVRFGSRNDQLKYQ